MSHPHASTKGLIFDQLAISMAVLCAIHCLVTPVLLVVLPILATTFWVSENFHLWMLLLVIPTTTLAVFCGCRKHRDQLVVILAAIGLTLLVTALVSERVIHHQAGPTPLVSTAALRSDSETGAGPSFTACQSCSRAFCAVAEDPGTGPSFDSPGIGWLPLLNTLGGVFLVAGHARNFLLCRKSRCSHEAG